MTDKQRIADDIAYVRAVAERTKVPRITSIFRVWALLALAGFVLVDIADDRRWVGIYWMVAGPAGFVLSWWLGTRASREAGLRNRALGVRHAQHWLAFMAAGVLGLALVRTGQLTWPGFGSLWVLLLALSYFHGGVHLDRRMVPIGLVAAGAYLFTIWVPGFGWTIAGVALAAALASAAAFGVSEPDAAG